jgi:DNA-binding transcriptional ArsR family regulator
MLRIFFTSEDIARTRIAPAADPLWELVMSLHMLRPQPGDLLFKGWRRTTATALRQARLGHHFRLLLALTPTVGYFPDFLNPITAINGIDHGLETIRSTPKATLTQDLRQLALSGSLPAATRPIATGEPNALTQLTDAMRTGYDLMVAPHRHTLDTAIQRDHRIRTTALAAAGVEGMLATFHPMMSWSSGELQIRKHPDQELHLGGRGLLLIPSYFCLTGPITMFDPSLPPVLVYRISRQPDELLPTGRSAEALKALIGTTRAAVLETIGQRHTITTTEVARRLGISAATASEHTTILRQAGLTSRQRDGNRMLHQLTTLGQMLLDNARSPRSIHQPTESA